MFVPFCWTRFCCCFFHFTNLMIKVSAPDEQLASLCVKKILMIQVLGILKINAVQLAFQRKSFFDNFLSETLSVQHDQFLYFAFCLWAERFRENHSFLRYYENFCKHKLKKQKPENSNSNSKQDLARNVTNGLESTFTCLSSNTICIAMSIEQCNND